MMNVKQVRDLIRALSNPEGINQYTKSDHPNAQMAATLDEHGFQKDPVASARHPHRDVYTKDATTHRESTRSVASAMLDSQGRTVKQSVTSQQRVKGQHTVQVEKTGSRWEYYKPGDRPGSASSSKSGDDHRDLGRLMKKL